MGNWKTTCFAALVGTALLSSAAGAGEIDILVNKLVEKGVLSQGEAQQVVTETKEEVRKQNAKGTNESLPKWIQNTKFAGDLRVRYQGEDHSTDQTSVKHHRDRGRMRLRFGFESKPNDLMHVGFRLASGENKSATVGPEQTSTNQSFTNSYNNKFIWIDQAYVDYTPLGNTGLFLLKDTKLVGGKFPNPFYTTDLVWDGDTNPEGGYVTITPVVGSFNPWLTFGFLPFGESSTDSNDPSIWAGQIGVASTVLNRPYKVGLAYYDYENIKGGVPGTNGAGGLYSGQYTPTITNELDGTSLKYGFQVLQLAGEFSPIDLDLLGKTLPFTILGDYANNISDGINGGGIPHHTAWLLGAKLGKAKEKGTFELFYNYREIGQNSVYSWLNDSDFHLGGTASKGHKFGLTYAIMPNSTVSGAYYITEPYKPASTPALDARRINIIQVDWVTKF